MGIFKRMKNEGNIETVEAVEKEMYKDLGERMEMKTYITFDDVRKHLVEMIAENKKLREEVDRLIKTRNEWGEKERKRAELAQISADEYKSQLCEAKKKIDQLEQEILKKAAEIDRMEREKNKAITELEMMKVKKTKSDENKMVTGRTTPRKKKTAVAAEPEKLECPEAPEMEVYE